MHAFADAFNSILDDENFGVAATYRAGGSGDGVAIQVLRRMPDVTMPWSQTVVAAGACFFRLLVSDVAAPAAGDTLTIGTTVYTVLDHAPMRDALQLTHTIVARAA